MKVVDLDINKVIADIKNYGKEFGVKIPSRSSSSDFDICIPVNEVIRIINERINDDE